MVCNHAKNEEVEFYDRIINLPMIEIWTICNGPAELFFRSNVDFLISYSESQLNIVNGWVLDNLLALV